MELTKLFSNQDFGEIRLMEIEGAIYFVANDVAKALGYTNPSKATNDHCKKSLMTWGNDSLGRKQEFKVIPEGDVYRLVVKSQLPGAEKFESWIFDEVIPSIRNHGMYATEQTIDKILADPDFGIKLLTQLKEVQEKNKEQEKQLKIQEPKVQYVEKLLKSETTFSTTELAADFGMSAKRLNKELIHKKVIRKLIEGYVLTSAYLGKGYEYMLPIEKEGASMRQLRWTERGRAFIHWKLGITKELNPTQGKLELN